MKISYYAMHLDHVNSKNLACFRIIYFLTHPTMAHEIADPANMKMNYWPPSNVVEINVLNQIYIWVCNICNITKSPVENWHGGTYSNLNVV